ncbi:hypothetical protein OAR31_05900, partial [Candidatus Marinimicrobia bacterium]|nr:hypothetical protein [Candidatus Neomarinimicrobiota bacterium]
MERQYLTVDSSIRLDKSGKPVFRLQTLAVFEIIMTASDSFSLHLYLLRISLTANQLSQPPVIYRTFLFTENHPP